MTTYVLHGDNFIHIQKWKWWFPYVFVGSIVWIGVFSYFMVWWATEFGETAMIPPSVG